MDLNLLFDLAIAWSVLTGTRLRFMRCSCSIKLTVTLAASNCFEGLLMTFTIQIKPFMITQEFISLLRLKSLFLVSKHLLLCLFILDTSFKLLEKLFDLLRSDFGLINH